MDNLTHGLAGLLLSRAGLHRLCPRAAAILVVASELPDLDVVSALWGRDVYLDYHRGITHSFLGAPALAIVSALIAGMWRRPVGYSWPRAWLLSLIGLLGHYALDWTNIYGIRLLTPLSSEWFRADITSVIDLWIWAILLFGAGWPVLSRLVSSEIGAKPSSGAGVARFALALLLLYEGGRSVLHQRALDTVNAHYYDGRLPRRALALPSFANPWHWTAALDFGDLWRVHEVNLLREFDPTGGSVFHQAQRSAAVEAAAKTYSFQALERFSGTLRWEEVQLPEPEGAVRVSANDMRFGLPADHQFEAVAIVLANGQVERSWFQFSEPGKIPAPR